MGPLCWHSGGSWHWGLSQKNAVLSGKKTDHTQCSMQCNIIQKRRVAFKCRSKLEYRVTRSAYLYCSTVLSATQNYCREDPKWKAQIHVVIWHLVSLQTDRQWTVYAYTVATGPQKHTLLCVFFKHNAIFSQDVAVTWLLQETWFLTCI